LLVDRSMNVLALFEQDLDEVQRRGCSFVRHGGVPPFGHAASSSPAAKSDRRTNRGRCCVIWLTFCYRPIKATRVRGASETRSQAKTSATPVKPRFTVTS
jgi:hypothetical protein